MHALHFFLWNLTHPYASYASSASDFLLLEAPDCNHEWRATTIGNNGPVMRSSEFAVSKTRQDDWHVEANEAFRRIDLESADKSASRRKRDVNSSEMFTLALPLPEDADGVSRLEGPCPLRGNAKNRYNRYLLSLLLPPPPSPPPSSSSRQLARREYCGEFLLRRDDIRCHRELHYVRSAMFSRCSRCGVDRVRLK
jgi:hypothetical protein